jgi:hypothetical protein
MFTFGLCLYLFWFFLHGLSSFEDAKVVVSVDVV